jgi:hypothetical protein
METAARHDNPTIQLLRSHAPRSGSTIHRDVRHTKSDVPRRYIFHNALQHTAWRAAQASHARRYVAMSAQFKRAPPVSAAGD